MVLKNDIKKELAELNKELNSQLDFSTGSDDFTVFEKQVKADSLNFETLTLLKDIRDEMSLLRKNVFSDAESLITRKIKHDQELFFNKIKENFLTLSNQVVSSKDHNFQALRAENLNLQNELKKLRTNQELLGEKLNSITKVLLEKNIYDSNSLHEILDSVKGVKQKIDSNETLLFSTQQTPQVIIQNEKNYSLENNESSSDSFNTLDSNQVVPSLNQNELGYQDFKEKSSQKVPSLVEDRLARIDAALEDLK